MKRNTHRPTDDKISKIAQTRSGSEQMQSSSSTNRENRFLQILLQTRISIFGVGSVINKNTKAFLDRVSTEGEKLNAQIAKAETTNEGKSTKQARDVETSSAPKSSTIKKLVVNVNNANKQTRQFRLGLMSEIKSSAKHLIEDSRARGLRLSPKRETAEVTSDSTKKLLGMTRSQLRNANILRRGLLEKLAESRKHFFADVSTQGKQSELNWRKQMHQRELNRSMSRQKLLGRIGWAEKKDIEELNRKIATLTKIIEAQISASEIEEIELDRRHTDRRQRLLDQNFEKRLYDRREGDRSAA